MIPPIDPFHGILRSVVLAKPGHISQMVAIFEDGSVHELILGNGYGHVDNVIPLGHRDANLLKEAGNEQPR